MTIKEMTEQDGWQEHLRRRGATRSDHDAWWFAAVLVVVLAVMLGPTLFGGRILSGADVLRRSASFAPSDPTIRDYEPTNRLLIDPVLQFQPWLTWNRQVLFEGRLPLWNPYVGCGAPHLANGQSGVFDPFNVVVYLGPWPESLAWVAWARLTWAGLGMYWLCRRWGFGRPGRWLAGLGYPLSGFLIAWLQYPVTGAAIWLPWMIWATDRLIDQVNGCRIAILSLVVASTFSAGHIQTAAHVLVATFSYLVWRVHGRWLSWSSGVLLGLILSAPSIVPLGVYLMKSPVWVDREADRASAWEVTEPRWREALCTAWPDLYGSQRRGQPNLASALGVENLNESAGGFVGLPCLVLLAPLGWAVRRRVRVVGWASALIVFGGLLAFEVPPLSNLSRTIPVWNVIDHRRAALWVGFGLLVLGGAGLDHLRVAGRLRWPRTLGILGLAASLVLILSIGVVRWLDEPLSRRAESHYLAAAESTPGADPEQYRARAEAQARSVQEFVPRMLLGKAAVFAGFSAIAIALVACRGTGWKARRWVPWLLALNLIDQAGWALGYNPAIAPKEHHPESPVMDRLVERVGSRGRIVGLGPELPPNVAMRYGLADVRNYDSIELSMALDWLEPLFEPEPDRAMRSSRRTITWDRVETHRKLLESASVAAVVSASPPPPTLRAVTESERIGRTWIVYLESRPLVSLEGSGKLVAVKDRGGLINVAIETWGPSELVVRQCASSGWRVRIDGDSTSIISSPHDPFLRVALEKGASRVILRYEPPEVRLSLGLAIVGGLILVIFLVFQA